VPVAQCPGRTDRISGLFAEGPHEELAACIQEIGEWVTGKRSDPFQDAVDAVRIRRTLSSELLGQNMLPGATRMRLVPTLTGHPFL
jgi:hypothetical protein